MICASGAELVSGWAGSCAIADTDESEITWSIFILSLETLEKAEADVSATGQLTVILLRAFSPDGRTHCIQSNEPELVVFTWSRPPVAIRGV